MSVLDTVFSPLTTETAAAMVISPEVRRQDGQPPEEPPLSAIDYFVWSRAKEVVKECQQAAEMVFNTFLDRHTKLSPFYKQLVMLAVADYFNDDGSCLDESKDKDKDKDKDWYWRVFILVLCIAAAAAHRRRQKLYNMGGTAASISDATSDTNAMSSHEEGAPSFDRVMTDDTNPETALNPVIDPRPVLISRHQHGSEIYIHGRLARHVFFWVFFWVCVLLCYRCADRTDNRGQKI
jgi:hypothetical protein